jgi:hypothetical protein
LAGERSADIVKAYQQVAQNRKKSLTLIWLRAIKSMVRLFHTVGRVCVFSVGFWSVERTVRGVTKVCNLWTRWASIPNPSEGGLKCFFVSFCHFIGLWDFGRLELKAHHGVLRDLEANRKKGKKILTGRAREGPFYIEYSFQFLDYPCRGLTAVVTSNF